MEDRVKGRSIFGRVVVSGVVLVWLFLATICEARIIVVNDDGPADFNNIQAAIDDANNGDLVVVLPGTYTGEGNRDIDFLGKAITVRGTDPNDADIIAATVINCQGSSSFPHRGFCFHSGEDANSILAGLTIRNGFKGSGGGISCGESSPTIRNCTIKSSTGNLGGGIYCADSNMVVVNCIITDNTAQGTNYENGGGGVFVWSGNPTISKCTISNNTAEWAGGICCFGGTATITDCVITGNSASGDPGWGGAIHGLFGPTAISNCIITANSAKLGGGVFSIVRRGNSRIVNCVISGNKANSGGGFYCYEGELAISGCTIVGNSACGIRCAEEGCAAVDNCVLWDNRADMGPQVSLGGGTSISISYSDIQGGQGDIRIASGAVLDWGDGNIDILPRFVGTGFWDTGDVWVEGDYHLLGDSPCIDSGDPNYVAGPNETDIDGEPRMMGLRVDMGADEAVGLSIYVNMDELWMYQNLPDGSDSSLTASALITYDPNANSSYSYEWEIVQPADVNLAPVTVAGGGAGDAYWTFAARGCDEPGGLSESGQTFTVRVTVTGDDYGNTGVAEAEFGIALLGDVNNDAIINVADRSIANAFWRFGSVGSYTFRDCDVNSDGIINVADRSIANAVWRGLFGQNQVSSPCPLR